MIVRVFADGNNEAFQHKDIVQTGYGAVWRFLGEFEVDGITDVMYEASQDEENNPQYKPNPTIHTPFGVFGTSGQTIKMGDDVGIFVGPPSMAVMEEDRLADLAVDKNCERVLEVAAKTKYKTVSMNKILENARGLKGYVAFI